MAIQRLGIIMHGVTGRMGMNQHLIRSIGAIRAEGGVLLANGDRVLPDPLLVGRNAEKIEALARHGWNRTVAVEPFDYVPDGAGSAAFAAGYLRGIRESLV